MQSLKKINKNWRISTKYMKHSYSNIGKKNFIIKTLNRVLVLFSGQLKDKLGRLSKPLLKKWYKLHPKIVKDHRKF